MQSASEMVCKLEAQHVRDPGQGLDRPHQCSTNMLVILENRPAYTFSSEQQSLPTAEEDGVSLTVTKVTAVLHRGVPCLRQSM